jgi:hypothetical protein
VNKDSTSDLDDRYAYHANVPEFMDRVVMLRM